MRLISGYTDAAQQKHWNEKCKNAAITAMEITDREIENIASEMAGIEDSIFEARKCKDDWMYICQYLRDKAAKLEELYNRREAFERQVKAYGGMDD